MSVVQIDIAEVFAQAEANTCVNLARGDYFLAEKIVINKPLTIKGAGREVTRIIVTAKDVAIRFHGESWWVNEDGNYSAVSHQCAWKISDLTIEYKGSSPINLIEAQGGTLMISECIIAGAVGLQGDDDLGIAVYLNGSCHSRITKTSITGNDNFGLIVGGRSVSVTDQNSITDNGLGGIKLCGNSLSLIQYNEISRNGQCGLLVTDFAEGCLIENICIDNKDSGVLLMGDSNASLVRNQCCNNENYGLQITDSAGCCCCNNEFESNEVAGIAFSGCAGGIVKSNTCSNNIEYGIVVYEQAVPLLESNRCNENGQFGILYSDTAAGKAINNIAINNLIGSIEVNDQASPFLEDNLCRASQFIDKDFYYEAFPDFCKGCRTTLWRGWTIIDNDPEWSCGKPTSR